MDFLHKYIGGWKRYIADTRGLPFQGNGVFTLERRVLFNGAPTEEFARIETEEGRTDLQNRSIQMMTRIREFHGLRENRDDQAQTTINPFNGEAPNARWERSILMATQELTGSNQSRMDLNRNYFLIRQSTRFRNVEQRRQEEVSNRLGPMNTAMEAWNNVAADWTEIKAATNGDNAKKRKQIAQVLNVFDGFSITIPGTGGNPTLPPTRPSAIMFANVPISGLQAKIDALNAISVPPENPFKTAVLQILKAKLTAFNNFYQGAVATRITDRNQAMIYFDRWTRAITLENRATPDFFAGITDVANYKKLADARTAPLKEVNDDNNIFPAAIWKVFTKIYTFVPGTPPESDATAKTLKPPETALPTIFGASGSLNNIIQKVLTQGKVAGLGLKTLVNAAVNTRVDVSKLTENGNKNIANAHKALLKKYYTVLLRSRVYEGIQNRIAQNRAQVMQDQYNTLVPQSNTNNVNARLRLDMEIHNSIKAALNPDLPAFWTGVENSGIQNGFQNNTDRHTILRICRFAAYQLSLQGIDGVVIIKERIRSGALNNIKIAAETTTSIEGRIDVVDQEEFAKIAKALGIDAAIFQNIRITETNFRRVELARRTEEEMFDALGIRTRGLLNYYLETYIRQPNALPVGSWLNYNRQTEAGNNKLYQFFVAAFRGDENADHNKNTTKAQLLKYLKAGDLTQEQNQLMGYLLKTIVNNFQGELRNRRDTPALLDQAHDNVDRGNIMRQLDNGFDTFTDILSGRSGGKKQVIGLILTAWLAKGLLFGKSNPWGAARIGAMALGGIVLAGDFMPGIMEDYIDDTGFREGLTHSYFDLFIQLHSRDLDYKDRIGLIALGNEPIGNLITAYRQGEANNTIDVSRLTSFNRSRDTRYASNAEAGRRLYFMMKLYFQDVGNGNAETGATLIKNRYVDVPETQMVAGRRPGQQPLRQVLRESYSRRDVEAESERSRAAAASIWDRMVRTYGPGLTKVVGDISRLLRCGEQHAREFLEKLYDVGLPTLGAQLAEFSRWANQNVIQVAWKGITNTADIIRFASVETVAVIGRGYTDLIGFFTGVMLEIENRRAMTVEATGAEFLGFGTTTNIELVRRRTGAFGPDFQKLIDQVKANTTNNIYRSTRGTGLYSLGIGQDTQGNANIKAACSMAKARKNARDSLRTYLTSDVGNDFYQSLRANTAFLSKIPTNLRNSRPDVVRFYLDHFAEISMAVQISTRVSSEQLTLNRGDYVVVLRAPEPGTEEFNAKVRGEVYVSAAERAAETRFKVSTDRLPILVRNVPDYAALPASITNVTAAEWNRLSSKVKDCYSYTASTGIVKKTVPPVTEAQQTALMASPADIQELLLLTIHTITHITQPQWDRMKQNPNINACYTYNATNETISRKRNADSTARTGLITDRAAVEEMLLLTVQYTDLPDDVAISVTAWNRLIALNSRLSGNFTECYERNSDGKLKKKTLSPPPVATVQQRNLLRQPELVRALLLYSTEYQTQLKNIDLRSSLDSDGNSLYGTLEGRNMANAAQRPWYNRIVETVSAQFGGEQPDNPREVLKARLGIMSDTSFKRFLSHPKVLERVNGLPPSEILTVLFHNESEWKMIIDSDPKIITTESVKSAITECIRNINELPPANATNPAKTEINNVKTRLNSLSEEEKTRYIQIFMFRHFRDVTDANRVTKMNKITALTVANKEKNPFYKYIRNMLDIRAQINFANSVGNELMPPNFATLSARMRMRLAETWMEASAAQRTALGKYIKRINAITRQNRKFKVKVPSTAGNETVYNTKYQAINAIWRSTEFCAAPTEGRTYYHPTEHNRGLVAMYHNFLLQTTESSEVGFNNITEAGRAQADNFAAFFNAVRVGIVIDINGNTKRLTEDHYNAINSILRENNLTARNRLNRIEECKTAILLMTHVLTRHTSCAAYNLAKGMMTNPSTNFTYENVQKLMAQALNISSSTGDPIEVALKGFLDRETDYENLDFTHILSRAWAMMNVSWGDTQAEKMNNQINTFIDTNMRNFSTNWRREVASNNNAQAYLRYLTRVAFQTTLRLQLFDYDGFFFSSMDYSEMDVNHAWSDELIADWEIRNFSSLTGDITRVQTWEEWNR